MSSKGTSKLMIEIIITISISITTWYILRNLVSLVSYELPLDVVALVDASIIIVGNSRWLHNRGATI